MPKEQKQHVDVALGSPAELINLFTKEQNERDWIFNKIVNEGPPHKQWQHTLVLVKMQELIEATSKATGKQFKPLVGPPIIVDTPEWQLELPLSFSDESLGEAEKELHLREKLSKGPEHEIAYTAILLQAIEWLKSSLASRN